jgi:hypothetical protein
VFAEAESLVQLAGGGLQTAARFLVVLQRPGDFEFLEPPLLERGQQGEEKDRHCKEGHAM